MFSFINQSIWIDFKVLQGWNQISTQICQISYCLSILKLLLVILLVQFTESAVFIIIFAGFVLCVSSFTVDYLVNITRYWKLKGKCKYMISYFSFLWTLKIKIIWNLSKAISSRLLLTLCSFISNTFWKWWFWQTVFANILILSNFMYLETTREAFKQEVRIWIWYSRGLSIAKWLWKVRTTCAKNISLGSN